MSISEDTDGEKGLILMAVVVREDYQKALEEQKKEVRSLVLEGLEQIKQSKTKDFNAVCDRLEKKYTV